MNRMILDPADGSAQELSTPVGSGGAFAGGYMRRTDTSIVRAVVDNSRFGYFAFCQLPREDPKLRIAGVSVRYSP